MGISVSAALFRAEAEKELQLLKQLQSLFEEELAKHSYDIVMSFAGEDRQFARRLADGLRKRVIGYRFVGPQKISVFYDEYEQPVLWGENLYERLATVYGGARFYCIMIISEHYVRKVWTTHERRSAQARALNERESFILPVRLDDSAVPGLLDTVGYVDGKKTTTTAICKMVLQKIKNRVQRMEREVAKKISSNINTTFSQFL